MLNMIEHKELAKKLTLDQLRIYVNEYNKRMTTKDKKRQYNKKYQTKTKNSPEVNIKGSKSSLDIW